MSTREGPSTVRVSWGLGESSVSGFVPFLKQIILETGARQVCDVGGGAKPVLSMEMVTDLNLDYTVLDASAVELDKAPRGYRKLQADILDSDRLPVGGFDLVFSRMLAEHVIDPALFHTNIGRMLSPTGHAVHYFPTLYEPVFVANRVLPERLASAALVKLARGTMWPAQRPSSRVLPVVPRSERRPGAPLQERWARGRVLRRFLRDDELLPPGPCPAGPG